jgi:DNA-binding response OmpR family regulator
LAVSSSTEAGRVKEAIDAGVTEFLAKPISVAELQKKLTMVMSPPRRLVTSENYCGPDRRRSVLPTRLRRRNTDFDIVEL